jgi:3-oxoacyl-[acyl-carrier protein] reductase
MEQQSIWYESCVHVRRSVNSKALAQVQTVAVEACTGTLAFLLSDRAAFITGQCIQTARPPQHPRTKSPRAHMQGRNVLLTGASQGIGEVTARLLAAAGANLLLLDHPQTETRISELAKNLECEYLTADVTSRDTPTRVVESIRTTFGGTVHAAIHNAGITADKTFRRMDAQLFTRVIDVNLRAVIAQTTAMLSGDKPSLAEDGRIVCVSSVNGIAGAFGQTNYAASKSGIIGYVSHMQHVLDKVAINAVAPGSCFPYRNSVLIVRLS